MKTTKNIYSIGAVILFIVFLSIITLNAYENKDASNNSKDDIVSTALKAGKFNTLAKALSEADLVKTLQSEGPFTVFAPTDEAFAKLPKGTLDNLLKDKEALKNILLYHVVSGEVMSSDVVKIDKASTAAKKEIKISQKWGNVYINDSMVIKADVKASNGVIHIIDSVLIP